MSTFIGQRKYEILKNIIYGVKILSKVQFYRKECSTWQILGNTLSLKTIEDQKYTEK